MSSSYVSHLDPSRLTFMVGVNAGQAWPEGEVKTAEAVRLRAEVLQELGWSHWARVERSALARNFPPSYPLL